MVLRDDASSAHRHDVEHHARGRPVLAAAREGLLVVDLSQFLSGPSAALRLAEKLEGTAVQAEPEARGQQHRAMAGSHGPLEARRPMVHRDLDPPVRRRDGGQQKQEGREQTRSLSDPGARRAAIYSALAIWTRRGKAGVRRATTAEALRFTECSTVMNTLLRPNSLASLKLGT